MAIFSEDEKDRVYWTFSVKVESDLKEITDWHNDTHCFTGTNLHVTLTRSDGRQKHIYDDDAREFFRIMGAPNAFRSKERMNQP